MKEKILGNIVEAEEKIAADLKRETDRSEQLLSGLRKETDRELIEEENRLQNALAIAVADARADAEEKAEAVQEEAEARAIMLEKTGDDLLEKVIRSHLSQILK